MKAWADVVSEAIYSQAESPRLDPRTGELFWVDLATDLLHIGRYEAGMVCPTAQYSVGARIGSACADGGSDGWVIAAEREFVRLTRSGAMEILGAVEQGVGYFNDGVCDAAGRFWVGTQTVPRTPTGALFTLDGDRTVQQRLANVTVSNGISFSADGSRLYYIDTLPHRTIESFDVDPDGRLSNRQVVVQINGGNPDGMTIDDEGCLWVAVWDASEVRRYSPSGTLLDCVRVAARRPTAVALLGTTLLISTASVGIDDPSDLGGHFFAAAAPCAGQPSLAYHPVL
jgi:sugar lactone lactonase YvrE